MVKVTVHVKLEAEVISHTKNAGLRPKEVRTQKGTLEGVVPPTHWVLQNGGTSIS